MAHADTFCFGSPDFYKALDQNENNWIGNLVSPTSGNSTTASAMNSSAFKGNIFPGTLFIFYLESSIISPTSGLRTAFNSFTGIQSS